MLRKDFKRCLLAMFIVAILILCQSGIRTCAIVCLAILSAGFAVISAVWLFAFILVAVIDKSLSSAWHYVHPVTMLKECFCEQKGEKDEVRD